GIEIIMCTWSGIKCPSSIRLSFWLPQLSEHLHEDNASVPVQRLSTTHQHKHQAIPALPFGVA
ncbi:MAG: hypothetical protein M0038_03410, partial [Pseudomonadota bacterium]|nr:hypothetical protein [Pseudomonadota bacterium]